MAPEDVPYYNALIDKVATEAAEAFREAAESNPEQEPVLERLALRVDIAVRGMAYG
jgi:hypothetical protein